MAAFGRLWRRAPAWRLCLIGGVVFTGLAAMFPPPLPHIPWPGSAGTSAGGASASYHAAAGTTTDAPHSDEAYGSLPPFGAGRSGTIPFAGHQIPLPPGTWQDLLVMRTGDGDQALILGRIDGGKLTGLMLASAPTPTSNSAGPVSLPPACYVPSAIAQNVTPSGPGESPLRHACWTLLAIDMQKANQAADPADPIRRAIDRLAPLDIAVPTEMLALNSIRSDETGALAVRLFLPGSDSALTGAGGKARMKGLGAWIDKYEALLRKGYEHSLGTGDKVEPEPHLLP